MLSTIITKHGLSVLSETMSAQSPLNDLARHELIADIWENHAIVDQVEDEIDLIGFSPALVEQMSRMYDDDIDVIAQMDGVTLLLPFS